MDAEGTAVRLVAEADLTPEDDAAIRELLVVACPSLAASLGSRSWWGSRPDHRLLVSRADALLGHLALERRVIEVGSTDVVVAGIGGLAVHPSVRRQGVGRRLIEQLLRVLLTEVPVSFGYLTTDAAGAAFPAAVGLTRIEATVRYRDPDSGGWEVADPVSFVLPAGSPFAAWPAGPIDLRGTPW